MFCFRRLTIFMEMRILFSQKHLAPPTEPKLLVTGLVTMVLLGLTDLTSTPKIICVEIVKRKMRDTRTNHTDEFKTAIKAILGFRNTSAEPQAGHLNTTPH